MPGPNKEAALRYAQLGYRVLPLRAIVAADGTGERRCSCADKNCRSAGKHPLTSVVPHGLTDASSNTQDVDHWPDDINVGIATGDGLVVLDVDDQNIAAQVVETITDEVVVRTGRGAHVYKRVAKDFATAILKQSNGERIGELRSSGAYVVAPPSLHLEGQYTFTALSLEDIGTTQDGYEWAASVLRRVGIELENKSAHTSLPDAPSSIPPVTEIPITIPEGSMYLDQLLTGTYRGFDRSSSLYRLACELYRAAAKSEEEIDQETIAGIIKHRDDQSYRKYSDRGDRDVRYWEIAVRSHQDVKANGDQAPAPPRYAWDGENFLIITSETSKPICNFEPLIVEELSVLTDENEAPSLVWRVQCRQGKRRVVDIDLSPSQRKDARAMREVFTKYLPADFIVRARRWEDLMEGMQEYSRGRTRKRSAYGLTGWLPDRPSVFLLPQRALSDRGVESAIGYDNMTADMILRRYGEDMEPPGAQGREEVLPLLRDLVTVSLPEIVVPLLAQIFGAAMLSRLDGSVEHTRCIVHVFGRTGSYKTSLVNAMLSVWGSSLSRNSMRSWSSTDNALQFMLYMSRDLPVVIDDYKASLVRNRSTFTQLVQNYADGTTRERLTISGGGGIQSARSAVPRGLMITTGEDVWEDQESLLARTVVVSIDRSSTDLGILSRLQAAAADGSLARIGADWIQWLSANMERALKAHEKGYRKYRSELEGVHGRSRDNIAQLRTFDGIFAQFIKEHYGGIEYDRISREAWRVITDRHMEEQYALADLSPLNQLLDAIRLSIDGSAYLLGKNASDPTIGAMRGDLIGYVDADSVYISRAQTYGWYRREMARQGQSVPFSWKAVCKEAKDRFGSLSTVTRAGGSVSRLLRLPRREVFEIESEVPTASEDDADV